VAGTRSQQKILLLPLIHRRVRQHSLVILDPSEIAGIKPSTAPVAFEEVLALVKWWSADALADPGPARPRPSIGMIPVMRHPTAEG
jgi:hypothetical protein